jgi:hypothetical protein
MGCEGVITLRDNANAIVFGAGFVALVRGVALWSPAAAYVVAGGVLMLVGAWPFLRLRKG